MIMVIVIFIEIAIIANYQRLLKIAYIVNGLNPGVSVVRVV